MVPEPPGAASFCLEPEPIQVGRSRSRLRDLGDLELEPEPPKKVAAPQHCAIEPAGIIFIMLYRYIVKYPDRRNPFLKQNNIAW